MNPGSPAPKAGMLPLHHVPAKRKSGAGAKPRILQNGFLVYLASASSGPPAAEALRDAARTPPNERRGTQAGTPHPAPPALHSIAPPNSARILRVPCYELASARTPPACCCPGGCWAVGDAVAQRACPQAACERALPPSCAERRHTGRGRSAVRAVQGAAQAASQQATTLPAPGSGAARFQSSSVLQLRGSRCVSVAAGGTCVNRSVRFGLGGMAAH